MNINSIILGIGVVLVIIILIMVFRVQSLLSMVRRTSTTERVGRSNRINASMWLWFMVIGGIATIWSAISASEYFLPEASSVHGIEIDRLFWITNGILAAIFLATNILLFFFAHRYQYKEGRKAHFYPDNNRLEVAWTVIPAIVLTLLVLSGWQVWRDITREAPDNAEVVEIMGYQFAWNGRYPGADGQLGLYNYRLIDPVNEFGMDLTDESSLDDFTTTGEIHIPKGRPVHFKIRARDVLHSVYAPHFRLKMDAVPGMPTSFWFVATKSTNDMRAELNDPEFDYEIACAEICGRGHFSMRMRVIVEEERDYQAWLQQQRPWLANNKDYLSRVPVNLQERALRIINGTGAGANTSNAVKPGAEEPGNGNKNAGSTVSTVQ